MGENMTGIKILIPGYVSLYLAIERLMKVWPGQLYSKKERLMPGVE